IVIFGFFRKYSPSGWSGKTNRYFMVLNRLQKQIGTWLFNQKRTCSEIHREQNQSSQTKSKPDRRTSRENILFGWLQGINRESLANIQNIFVIMSRHFGISRSSRSKAYNGYIIGFCRVIFKSFGFGSH